MPTTVRRSISWFASPWVRRARLTLALVLVLGAAGALPPRAARAAVVGTVRIVIERVRALDCFDEPCVIFNPDQEADFYALLSIDGSAPPFKTGKVGDDDDISPDWQFARTVDFAGRATLPLHIEIWDDDTGSPTDPDPDQADLKPSGGRPLDLTLDASACQVGGDVAGACNTQLTSSGTEDDSVQIWFRVEFENTGPSISGIPDQVTNEDTPTAPIPFTVGDAETPADNLVLSGSSSNQALVPDANIRFGGSGENRTVTVSPAPNASGTARITIRVDDGGSSAETPFLLTVVPVPDRPSISAIPDQTTPEDIALGPIAFTVGDPDTPIEQITLSAESSNQAIVANRNIVLGGSGIERTLTITPTHNAIGTVLITVRASDEQGNGEESFNLTVLPENDHPTIGTIENQKMVVDSDPLVVSFRVSDPETPADTLIVSASSSNPALIPNDHLLPGGSGESHTLALQPLAGALGRSTITVSVSDGGQISRTTFELEVEKRPPVPPPPWLVLIYMAGDDIEPTGNGQTSLTAPLNDLRARLRGLDPNLAMRLVVLFDGNGAHDSQVYVREPGSRRLAEIAPSWMPADHELDTGSPDTLREFIRWARATYPGSPHTMLSIIDHGGGWSPDEGADGQPRGRIMAKAGGLTGMSFDASANGGVGSSLSTKETGQALDGLGRFDVLFFDACLMGMVESANEVQPYADYFIAGESLLWSQLPYERYFDPAFFTAAISAEALAKGIVEKYNISGSPGEPYAIAAIDMSRLPAVVERAGALASALLAALQPHEPGPAAADGAAAAALIKKAYLAAQKFDYDSDYTLEQDTDGFADARDFAQRLLDGAPISAEATQAARALIGAIGGKPAEQGAVLATKAVSGTTKWSPSPWNFAGAHGLSIYLPLGERDCRPTGKFVKDTGVPAIAPCQAPATPNPEGLTLEPQLSYYLDPDQLAFTRQQPEWAALLFALGGVISDTNSTPHSPFPVKSPQFKAFVPFTQQMFTHPPGADLVISDIEVRPASPHAGDALEVIVTLVNRGSAPLTEPVWVDLYVDPRETPQLNQIWPELSKYGASWRVYDLGPGDSRQLSTRATDDPAEPQNRYSNFPRALPGGSYTLYAFADSYKPGSLFGAQREGDEGNNLSRPYKLNIKGSHAPLGHESVPLIDKRST